MGRRWAGEPRSRNHCGTMSRKNLQAPHSIELGLGRPVPHGSVPFFGPIEPMYLQGWNPHLARMPMSMFGRGSIRVANRDFIGYRDQPHDIFISRPCVSSSESVPANSSIRSGPSPRGSSYERKGDYDGHAGAARVPNGQLNRIEEPRDAGRSFLFQWTRPLVWVR